MLKLIQFGIVLRRKYNIYSLRQSFRKFMEMLMRFSRFIFLLEKIHQEHQRCIEEYHKQYKN